MIFHLQQIDSKSVLFDIVSNTAVIGSLNVCWKEPIFILPYRYYTNTRSNTFSRVGCFNDLNRTKRLNIQKW